MIDLQLLGYKKNYYIEDATDNASDNLKFDSDTAQKYIVPAGKRWLLIGGNVNRDVSSTLLVRLHDAANKVILTLANESAGTGVTVFPNGGTNDENFRPIGPIILDAGEYVRILFGTAQTGAAWASCMVIEVGV